MEALRWNATHRIEVLHHFVWHLGDRFVHEADTYEHMMIFAVEAGMFAYRMQDLEGVASAGDLVCCPPGITLHRRALNDLTFHYILCDVVDEQGVTIRDAACLPLGRISVKHNQRLHNTYELLREASRIPAPQQPWVDHLVNDIWQLICFETSSAVTQGGTIWSDRWKRRLHEAAFNGESLSALADEAGLSPVQFSRKFSAAAGVLPSEYISGLRIQRACDRLQNSDASIEDIAADCGLSNRYYFTRLFTRQMGIPPAKYRKLHRI
ncbi:AraC family transcriptional regulator [Paenibacillus mendelii]|uniref:Helix-turn-helix domain-containing protein n=1 Tax=Paenibacillus mendelii TaxID=206163 RepID=A0ABV6JG74_9BACL|nr:AraC family transcriptional regulator [Paenibacillus mendelii]MCQ6557783.1 AraC family transcriptional regulator [Paenibacillus mendelii]